MKGHGRRIVVDADVGRTAADLGRADRGGAVDARALVFSWCLEAMYDARHVAVFSPSLWMEWRKHARRGSAGFRWLVQMADRKLVNRVNPEPDAGWLEEVIHDELPDGDREVALKDRHLVATATAKADDRLL